VVDVKGGQIRLGIEAPADLRIYREEIYIKVQRENQLAANWNMTDFDRIARLLEGKK
jgi:carbon storage regulator